MTRYAANTEVPSDRSRSEIERTLARYGADQFVYGWDPEQAVIGFRMADRQIKFALPLPDRQRFRLTPTGRTRSRPQQEAEYEKAVRQRWRALALVIKAKLEAVDSDIAVFEDEFLAHIVLPDGRTFGQWARPQIDHVYTSGEMPALMPGVSA